MGRKPAVCTMGGAIFRRFALFPLMLLMLLLLPAGMVAQTKASWAKYIATYDSDTQTLTFKKYTGESLPDNSAWVEDGKSVFELNNNCLRRQNIKHIVLDESFKTFTPTSLNSFFARLSYLETIQGLEYLNTTNVTDMFGMFNHCVRLTSLDVTHFNTEKVTNMSQMFNDCPRLASLDVTSFNTANVTDMENMFSAGPNLKTIYASDKFVTNAVTNSSGMFAGCKSLSGDIDWTSGNATDNTYAKLDGGYFREKGVADRPWVKYADGTLTFLYGYKRTLGENEYELNSGEGVPAWGTNKNNITQVVFDASFANARPTTCFKWFSSFSKLTQVKGVENLNTENVTNMGNMFKSCLSLASLDVTHFNTANVTNMDFMFFDCSSLTSLDVTHFNTAKVEGMSGMFAHCNSLTSLDVTHFNTEKVTNMRQMFNDCPCLTSLDVTNFNTANVTNMEYMFYSCSSLKTIYASDKFVTNAETKSSGMFEGCNSLSGDIDWTSDNAADKTYAKLDGGYFREKGVADRPWVKYADGTLTFLYGYKKTLGENEYELNSGTHLPAWYEKKDDITKVVFDASFANARPTSCYLWFYDFGNLKQIEGIENLNTTNVTEMASMFYGCSQLTSLDVTHFNTEKVTNMLQMFTDCRCLTSLDVTNFNTANVTNMGYMFYGCSQLTSLDVTHFNTANVFAMNSMFSGCSSLTSLDVTHLNTANVLAMNDMFSGCSSLTSLDVSHFNTKNVEYIMNIFKGCSALTTIYASDKFVMDKAYKESVDMFKDCTNLKGAITEYDESKTDYHFANYKTGYFTKLVGKNGDEKIGATGETLATDNLVLADDKDFVAYEPFAAKAASYNRTMKEGSTWGTLCLPFAIAQSQVKECKFFSLIGIDNVNDCITLESYEEGAEIPAGTPVLFKMNEGQQTLSISAQNADLVTEPKTGTNTDANLVGSFIKIGGKDNQGLADNDYIISKNKFWRVADLTGGKGVGSKPMHAYIRPATASQARAAMLSIGKGDGTTAIDNLNAISNDANAEYYDANGLRTNGLQKGLNIVKRGSKTYKIMVK